MSDADGKGALVSFIIACYNETTEQLRESIDSALKQTYGNIEIIVVLDKPDNTELRSLITQYADCHDNITPVFNDVNMGPALVKNVGAKNAKGEYLAILDGDDISFPERIEKEFDVLIEENLDLTATNVVPINEAGKRGAPQKHREITEINFRKTFLHSNPINHSTVFMRTSLFRRLGGYRNIRGAEDYDLWARFLTAGARMRIISEPLVYHRGRDVGVMMSDTMLIHVAFKYSVKLYRERLAKGADSYSEERMKKFFTKAGYYNSERRKMFNESGVRLKNAITDWRTKRSAGAFWRMFKLATANRQIAKWFIDYAYGVFVWHWYSDVVEDEIT
jgi:glycosyltransferase involved in cell wall biosynthesis